LLTPTEPPARPAITQQSTPQRLPRTVDLRDRFAAYGQEPRAQGKRGTCSLFAMIGVLEYESAKDRPEKQPRLSPDYLNWASHRTNDRTQDGSFFSDALNGIERYGVCREDLMPYADDYEPHAAPPATAVAEARARKRVTGRWIKEWDVKTGLTATQLSAIRQALAEGHPVAVGLRWPKHAHFDDQNVMNQPSPDEVFDGHSIVLVGYRDDPSAPGGGVFLFRNSAGPTWREGGYARFSYAYALAYANDALTLQVEDVGQKPKPESPNP